MRLFCHSARSPSGNRRLPRPPQRGRGAGGRAPPVVGWAGFLSFFLWGWIDRPRRRGTVPGLGDSWGVNSPAGLDFNMATSADWPAGSGAAPVMCHFWRGAVGGGPPLLADCRRSPMLHAIWAGRRGGGRGSGASCSRGQRRPPAVRKRDRPTRVAATSLCLPVGCRESPRAPVQTRHRRLPSTPHTPPLLPGRRRAWHAAAGAPEPPSRPGLPPLLPSDNVRVRFRQRGPATMGLWWALRCMRTVPSRGGLVVDRWGLAMRSRLAMGVPINTTAQKSRYLPTWASVMRPAGGLRRRARLIAAAASRCGPWCGRLRPGQRSLPCPAAVGRGGPRAHHPGRTEQSPTRRRGAKKTAKEKQSTSTTTQHA